MPWTICSTAPTSSFASTRLQNRIRLTASDAVVGAADRTISRILELYFGPNLTKEELRTLALSRPNDPLKPFSEACRDELSALQREA